MTIYVTLTVHPNNIACGPKSLYLGASDSLSPISALCAALANYFRDFRDIRGSFVFQLAREE